MELFLLFVRRYGERSSDLCGIFSSEEERSKGRDEYLKAKYMSLGSSEGYFFTHSKVTLDEVHFK